MDGTEWEGVLEGRVGVKEGEGNRWTGSDPRGIHIGGFIQGELPSEF